MSSGFGRMRGDLAGAVTGALVPLPGAMALGGLVFSPLGAEWIAFGAMAAIVAVALVNVAGILRNGVPFMMAAPYSLSALLLLGGVEILLSELPRQGGSPPPGLVLLLLFGCVFLSGGIQVLFGLLKIGGMARYIPYPVLVALMNGSACLIFISQVPPFLGLSPEVAWYELGAHLGSIQGSAVAVGLSVCLASYFGKRIGGAAGSLLVGFLAGVLVYALLALLGRVDLPASVGSSTTLLSTLSDGVNAMSAITLLEWKSIVLAVLPLIFGLAVLNSLRTLLVLSAAEHQANARFDSGGELIAQGIGNMASGLLGGNTAAGGMLGTPAAYRAGGRTRLSRGIAGVLLLLILSSGAEGLSMVPQVVLSGVLIMVALQSIDPWNFALLRNAVPAWREGHQGPMLDLVIVVGVTGAMVVVGIFVALTLGLLISLGWFIARMGKSVIRAEYSGDRIRSKTQRSREENALLDREGARISFLELHGSLFFGTADRVARRVEALLATQVEFIVLDFDLVTDVDSSGAKLVWQLLGRCDRHNIRLLYSGLDLQNLGHRELVSLLQGGAEAGSESMLTRGEALTLCEDKVLDEVMGRQRDDVEIPLEQMDLLIGFTADELAEMAELLDHKIYQDGEALFKQGVPGDGLYMLSQGRVEVFVRPRGGEPLYLGSLCRGTLVGEMAILDGSRRSADVVARGVVCCYHLTNERLQWMKAHRPELAMKVVAGMGRVLSLRLRYENLIRVG